MQGPGAWTLIASASKKRPTRLTTAITVATITFLWNADGMSNTISLAIEGMSCGHCVRAVKSALMGIAGVEDADVEIGRATVRAGSAVALDALVAVLEEEGYKASNAP